MKDRKAEKSEILNRQKTMKRAIKIGQPGRSLEEEKDDKPSSPFKAKGVGVRNSVEMFKDKSFRFEKSELAETNVAMHRTSLPPLNSCGLPTKKSYRVSNMMSTVGEKLSASYADEKYHHDT